MRGERADSDVAVARLDGTQRADVAERNVVLSALGLAHHPRPAGERRTLGAE
jgi:hypothetical protein